MSNFNFLKDINLDLYKIIINAENLFRDEYFEQATVQIRKFAENLCADILPQNLSENVTFDDMIQKIKDNSFENIRKKEFVDDLYFIKNNGNQAAHEKNSINSGEIALECLERAFEISIFYSHIKSGFDETLDKTLFDEKLLILQKKSPKNDIKTRYEKALQENRVIKTEKPAKRIKEKISSKKTDKLEIKKSLPVEKSKTNNTNFVKIIFFTLVFFTILLTIFAIIS